MWGTVGFSLLIAVGVVGVATSEGVGDKEISTLKNIRVF